MAILTPQLRERNGLWGKCYSYKISNYITVCSASRSPMSMVWKPRMILPAVMGFLTGTPHTRLGSARTGGLLWSLSFLSDTSTYRK